MLLYHSFEHFTSKLAFIYVYCYFFLFHVFFLFNINLQIFWSLPIFVTHCFKFKSKRFLSVSKQKESQPKKNRILWGLNTHMILANFKKEITCCDLFTYYFKLNKIYYTIKNRTTEHKKALWSSIKKCVG